MHRVSFVRKEARVRDFTQIISALGQTDCTLATSLTLAPKIMIPLLSCKFNKLRCFWVDLALDFFLAFRVPSLEKLLRFPQDRGTSYFSPIPSPGNKPSSFGLTDTEEEYRHAVSRFA